ncbi:MAG: hypothetical protein WD534_09520 [Phycisphaeraceae bacterium]
MPEMPQVRVPRLVVAMMLLGLFVLSLVALRQYGLAGDVQALTLAIVAGLLCSLTAAGLIYANNERYHARARANSRLNSSP